jgi:hypothetical protein
MGDLERLGDPFTLAYWPWSIGHGEENIILGVKTRIKKAADAILYPMVRF